MLLYSIKRYMRLGIATDNLSIRSKDSSVWSACMSTNGKNIRRHRCYLSALDLSPDVHARAMKHTLIPHPPKLSKSDVGYNPEQVLSFVLQLCSYRI